MVPRSIRNLDETNQKLEEHRQIGKVLEVTSRSLPSPLLKSRHVKYISLVSPHGVLNEFAWDR